MTFSLVLTITHPTLKQPIEHIDMLHGSSLAAVLKQLKLDNKQVTDLKNNGLTEWVDTYGATHSLELKEEAIN